MPSSSALRSVRDTYLELSPRPLLISVDPSPKTDTTPRASIKIAVPESCHTLLFSNLKRPTTCRRLSLPLSTTPFQPITSIIAPNEQTFDPLFSHRQLGYRQPNLARRPPRAIFQIQLQHLRSTRVLQDTTPLAFQRIAPKKSPSQLSARARPISHRPELKTQHLKQQTKQILSTLIPPSVDLIVPLHVAANFPQC